MADPIEHEQIIRVCIMRDAVCPHGFDCPFVGDGPMGYPCKEGWRNPPARALRESLPTAGDEKP